MNDDDFLELIRLVQNELIASGAPELANERHYIEDLGEDGDIALSPLKMLIEMLQAFDRHMSLRDHLTYRTAMSSISETLAGDGPEHAVVEGVRLLASDGVAPTANLQDAPDLASIRKELGQLISQLLEVPRGRAF